MSNDLKKEIDRVEANLSLENRFIAHQNALLHQRNFSPKIIPMILIGGFAFGFIFSRKKSIPQLVRSSTGLFLKGSRLYKNIKSFLPLLPL